MKSFKLICVLLLLSNILCAQKFDYVWVIGDNNQTADTTHGGATLDFNQLPVEAKYHFRHINMFVANASMSDTSGKLLFYTNGCDIAGADDKILPNGEGLNPGAWHSFLCDQNNDGYASGYPGIVILPNPDTSDVYYLFHQSIKYVFPPVEDAYVSKLLYSIIRKGNGIPKSYFVDEKNVEVIVDSLASGELNAVKHANGKDWWIILPRRNSNQFYVFLFTKDGIVDTIMQTIGDMPPVEEEGAGQTILSPNGDKMVRFFPHNPLMLYSFDRSTGHFTEYHTISIDYGTDWAFEGGCAISPNGRYLYVMVMLNVYQFDLWASDISSTQIKVATWDGVIDPIIITFLKCQLGPDCKIYILGGGDTRYYHIIHNPNEPGLNCNFEQRGLVLPTPSGASIPYFPNYRLGPIDNPGVPCSATVAINNPPQISRKPMLVYPNPAQNQVTFEFGMAQYGPKRLTIRNTVGQDVKDIILSESATSYVLSVQDLPAGIYWYAISGVFNISGKLVISH